MIPLMLGLGGLIAKVAAAAVIPRVFKALSAMGGSTETFRANPSKPVPETVSAPVQPSEKVLYGRSPLTAHSYRYSTYGERTKESGDLDSDWGYAGLWHHGPSGLDLATYRTYDSAQGRWISRDPLGESAGLNLYAYCNNNPISCIDPSGLQPPQSPPFPVLKSGNLQNWYKGPTKSLGAGLAADASFALTVVTAGQLGGALFGPLYAIELGTESGTVYVIGHGGRLLEEAPQIALALQKLRAALGVNQVRFLVCEAGSVESVADAYALKFIASQVPGLSMLATTGDVAVFFGRWINFGEWVQVGKVYSGFLIP